MGYLTRYNPFIDLDRFFDPESLNVWPWPENRASDVSITKDKKSAHISINAVGFKKDEVSIEVTRNTLRVKGKLTKDAENGRAYFSKNFEYSWTLADTHDVDNIESKLENGILTINVPFKTPEKEVEEKRLIEVK